MVACLVRGHRWSDVTTRGVSSKERRRRRGWVLVLVVEKLVSASHVLSG
jgi:hypothetical protein